MLPFFKNQYNYEMFDNFPDGIIIIDYKKNIVYWNKKSTLIFEYEPSEAKGKNIGLVFIDEIEKIYQNLSTDKGTILTARKKSGEELYVEISCGNSEKEGEFIIVFRDVTKNQRVLEKLLIEYEKSSKISQNKSSFIANLSHELKTPIHSVIGFSQALLDGLGQDLNQKQEKYVSIINRNANSLLSLINSILDISKIESGKMDYNIKSFDIVSLVNNCIETVSPIINDKKLIFSSDLTDIVKRAIYSDETLLKQVLLNVLSNAAKFTNVGSISLKVSHPDMEFLNYHGIEIKKGMTDKSYMLFSISDTGVGIPEQYLNDIFDEYRQLDKAISKKYGGTGLGLATSKKILHELGGVIWVESELSKGSTFNFVIPIEKFVKPPEPENEVKKVEETDNSDESELTEE